MPTTLAFTPWRSVRDCRRCTVFGSTSKRDNQFGDLERCALRASNVHSADGWDESHASIFERTRPLQCPRSTSFWRRSGSNTRSGYRPTRFCRAASAICSRAQSDDLRTMCAGSMPISAIRPELGPSREGLSPRSSGGSPSHGKCSRRFCGSSRNCGRSHHQRQRETFDVMHSRAIDRRSASKCQGKWPDQTLDQAFGLSEVLVAVSTSRLSLQEGQENANIDAGLGFIWKISVKANMHMMMKSFFVATALIAAASSAQAQSYNWNSRRIVVDPPTAAQRAAADEEARREEKARDAVGNTSGASTTASATTQASGGGI